jgi:isoleucyl-tRNA synthetase
MTEIPICSVNTNPNELNIKTSIFWEECGIFINSLWENRDKENFVFYDGPPFATGKPHYGHILAGLIKDSILRYHHNLGKNVPRNAGWDCHGLPIEYEIEKELGIKTTHEILEYGIGNYNEKCRSIVLRYTNEWKSIMNDLGRWIDFENDYKTMTPQFMNSVWWVFKKLYESNRVYEGVKIMPYSPVCGTSLSNFETQQNYQEIKDDSLYIILPLVNNFKNISNIKIMVWTTTPWTLPSNYALCVNKNINYSIINYKNDNYKNDNYILATNLIEKIFKKDKLKDIKILYSFDGIELVGLEYTPPFTFNTMMKDKQYKILEDDYVSDSDGSGIVHIAPSHGEDDYRVCLKNGIITKEDKLFLPFDVNCYINDDIPEFKGLYYKNYKTKDQEVHMDFNTKVIIMLKEKGYYYAKEQIIHNYPFCWRSETPLIYRAVSSWFIKVEDMRDRLVELNKTINWYPNNIGIGRFHQWLSNARDWGVSRSRFWGTPIPIWKSDDGDIICVGSSFELEELAELEYGSITDLHRHFIDDIIIKKNGKTYKRINDVFDCWFESGSMPYGSLGAVGIVEILRRSDTGIEFNHRNEPFIKTHDEKIYNILPADFIAEGLDQTRGWFYTLLVLSASIFDMIPFKNVIVNGLILAEDGKKMSKKLKNYPDPMEVIEEYGSDPLRLYLLSSPAVRAESLKFSKTGVHSMMREIIIPLKNTVNFFKEYYNLCKSKNDSSKTSTNVDILINITVDTLNNPINIWILHEYFKLRNEYHENMLNYDLKNAINVLPKLVEIINNGYIKLGRVSLKGNDGLDSWIESLSTLYYLIKYILYDFRAIIPFFCEEKYQELKELLASTNIDTYFIKNSIHLENNLETFINIKESNKMKYACDFDIIYQILLGIYQLRGIHNISFKKPIRSVKIAVDESFENLYSNRYRENLSFISDEGNILDISVINNKELNIDKEIKPIKNEFFKKYGKSISLIYEELLKKDSLELDNLIKIGSYKDIQLDSLLFNIKYNITLNDDSENKDYVFKEIQFGSCKIILLLDKYYDEELDMKYYYRLIATKIQRCRKYAGLHPWDNINVYYTGVPKYNLDNEYAQKCIYLITKTKLLKYKDKNDLLKTSITIFYEKKFDNIDIKLYLEKL